ncbi:unnamed protein product [Phytophthora fragariaefolia]|uniref:Unnamed protein product n=1 Tax=Phytophthora fragariaefolia TaxID=1490495 RepID=A0A9W6Y6S9_9STRA|nr:unnamed protein product [Phytophthora fragariaefolia]
MRAFPVQDFIPVDGNVEPTTIEDKKMLGCEGETFESQVSNSITDVQAGIIRNQSDRPSQLNNSEAHEEHEIAKNGPTLQSKSDTKDNGVSALLSAVSTLPTFENDKHIKTKKQSKKVHAGGKSKLSAKPGPISQLPLFQPEEYSLHYPNSTVTAIQVRHDGSAIARWPSGCVAVSVDFEETAERSGFRVYAAHKDGQLALSFDPAGVGFLNAYPSGKTFLSTTSDGGGLLFDPTSGAILRQWNAQGELSDGMFKPVNTLGDEPEGSLLRRLSEYLVVRVQLCRYLSSQLETTVNTEQKVQAQPNQISLHIYFSGAPGIRHVFINSANRVEPSDTGECERIFGKTPTNGEVARATKLKPTPTTHVDFLSSIRAAVADL